MRFLNESVHDWNFRERLKINGNNYRNCLELLHFSKPQTSYSLIKARTLIFTNVIMPSVSLLPQIMPVKIPLALQFVRYTGIAKAFSGGLEGINAVKCILLAK